MNDRPAIVVVGATGQTGNKLLKVLQRLSKLTRDRSHGESAIILSSCNDHINVSVYGRYALMKVLEIIKRIASRMKNVSISELTGFGDDD